MKKKIQGRHNGSDFLAQLCGQNAKVAEIEQILLGGRLHFPEQLMRWFAAQLFLRTATAGAQLQIGLKLLGHEMAER